jgi:threonine/homoserine/homoserine lactone efflux protein
LAAVLGITLGLAAQAVLAALGVAAIVGSWPALFQTLQLAGVAYLLYLAVESWRDAGNPAHHLPGGGEDGAAGFRRGLVSNLLNPKAALLFVTVLPGFLSADAQAWETAVLSAVYLAVAVAVHLVIVAAAGALRGPLADPAVSVRMHRVQALTLAAVALWLFWRG